MILQINKNYSLYKKYYSDLTYSKIFGKIDYSFLPVKTSLNKKNKIHFTNTNYRFSLYNNLNISNYYILELYLKNNLLITQKKKYFYLKNNLDNYIYLNHNFELTNKYDVFKNHIILNYKNILLKNKFSKPYTLRPENISNFFKKLFMLKKSYIYSYYNIYTKIHFFRNYNNNFLCL